MDQYVSHDIIQNFSGLNQEQCKTIQSLIEDFAERYQDLETIFLATIDGFEIAAVTDDTEWGNVRRLSAMSSSLLSISLAMMREVSNGKHKVAMLEGEDHNILLYLVPTAEIELILTIVSSTEKNMGQLYWLIKSIARSIINTLQYSHDTEMVLNND